MNAAGSTTCVFGACVIVCAACGTASFAATRHVAKHGGHSAPYTSWADAATNVGAAISAAVAGDTVLVSNGVWDCNIRITTTLTLKSVAGACVTVLDGGQRGTVLYCEDPAGQIVIEGFTIANGIGAFGAGVMFYLDYHQGGAVRDCVLRQNLGVYGPFGGGGSGMYAGNGTVLVERCEFIDNENLFAGDAIFVAGDTLLNAYNCSFQQHHGSDVFNAWGAATLYNCLFARNTSRSGTISGGDIIGCTVVSNKSARGVVGPGGAQRIINSIIYANTPSNFNWYTTPPAGALHTLSTPALPGAGCSNAPPRFINWADDFRVTNSSPCINAGSNFVRITAVVNVCTALFDFGAAESVTTGNWNNITNCAAGVVCSNVLDTLGTALPWSMHILEAFDGTRTDGVVAAALYPASAQRDTFEANTNGTGSRRVATFAVEGLIVSNVYDLWFFASEDDDVVHNTRFTCNGKGESDILVPVGNSSNRVVLSRCAPDSNATLRIDMYATSGLSALLGVLEIIEGVPQYYCPLTDQYDLAGTNRMVYYVADIGAYEFTSNLAPRAQITLASVSNECSGASALLHGRENIPITWRGSGTDSDGTISDYLWDFGDGTSTNGPALTNIVHVFAAQDVFPVMLTVSDSAGAHGTTRVGIEIGPAIPCAPQALAGTNDAPESVRLSWHDAADDEDGFVLERAVVQYETILDNTDPRVTFYYDAAHGAKWQTATTLAGYYGANYAFVKRVAGDGNPYNTATYTPGLPQAGAYAVYLWHPNDSVSSVLPRVLAVDISTANGSAPITVYCNARGNGSQWRPLGAYMLTTSAKVIITAFGSYGTLPADAVRFVRADTFAPIAHLPADVTAFVDSNVTANVQYLYRVCATNSQGLSAYTSEISVDVLPEPSMALVTLGIAACALMRRS
jgi:hypothetical protein